MGSHMLELAEKRDFVRDACFIVIKILFLVFHSIIGLYHIKGDTSMEEHTFNDPVGPGDIPAEFKKEEE